MDSPETPIPTVLSRKLPGLTQEGRSLLSRQVPPQKPETIAVPMPLGVALPKGGSIDYRSLWLTVWVLPLPITSISEVLLAPSWVTVVRLLSPII